jgi:hypothetical protein
LIVCIALFSAAAPASAQSSSSLSADVTDRRALATQLKVDALFDAGDFERAYFIYRNELAPLGDKYAQYMVGYMHVSGQGVAADAIKASAWYRLAAERDTPEFVAVRNRIMSELTQEQVQRSDDLFSDLLVEYSDLAVLLAAVKRDMRLISTRTGSRLQGEVSPVSIIDWRSGDVKSDANYVGRIEKRIEDRVRRLIEIGKFEGIYPEPGRLDMDELERLVNERIANWRG